MKNLTIKNAVSACSGEYTGPDSLLDLELASVVTDSRAASPGALFAAIPGERTDGHLYIEKAAALGAVCALAQRVPEGCTVPLIIVPDVQAALGRIAAFYRQQFDIPFIGITGSVGKTTAKEMTAAVLSRRYNVLKTEGNFNNELGVPLTIFRLRPEHEIAVIEMGISHFGEMRRLADIVRPDCAMFTLIGSAHLEFLGDRPGVLRAKSEILEGMRDDGTVIVNGDDDLLSAMHCRQKKLSFGLGSGCDVRAGDIEPTPELEIKCTLIAGDRRIPVTIPAHGEHMAYAAAAAAAAGMLFGLSDAEIAAGIAAYRPVGSRSRIVDTGRLRIIDDCYNANPTSVASALRSLARVGGKTACILGDMLELGENAAALHYETGALARQLGISPVLTVGELSRETARGAGCPAQHFDTADELISALPRLIPQGCTVLVKASHSMHFERICAALEAL